jgi:hypothetical protein
VISSRTIESSAGIIFDDHPDASAPFALHGRTPRYTEAMDGHEDMLMLERLQHQA